MAGGASPFRSPNNKLIISDNVTDVEIMPIGGAPYASIGGGRAVGLSGSPDGRRAWFAARARQLTGIADETLACAQYTDLGVSYEYSFSGIAAGTSTPNVGGPGILRINGGAAAQGGTINFPGFGSIFATASIALKRWYQMYLWRIPIGGSLPNANTRFYGLFSTGAMSGSVAIGINGTVQTAKYAFSAPNADASTASPALNVLSTVSPVIGPYAVGELAYDGSGVYGAINYEAPILVALPGVLPQNVSTTPQFESRPAGSGQTDVIDLDAMGMWMEQ